MKCGVILWHFSYKCPHRPGFYHDHHEPGCARTETLSRTPTHVIDFSEFKFKEKCYQCRGLTVDDAKDLFLDLWKSQKKDGQSIFNDLLDDNPQQRVKDDIEKGNVSLAYRDIGV